MHLVHALAGLGGDEQQRDIVHEVQVEADLAGVLFHREGILFDRVPFIDDHHTGFPFIENEAGNVCVLGGDAGGGIDHQQGHIGALDGFERTQDAVLLHAMFDLAALADAGRIDQGDFQAVHIDLCIGRIPCRAGDGTDDGAFLADQLIQQAGFAGVRLAHHRDLDAVVFLLRFLFGEGGHQRVEQVAGPGAVHGGDGIGSPSPSS